MLCCCCRYEKEVPYYTYLYIIKDRQLFGNTISPPFTEDEKCRLIEIFEHLPLDQRYGQPFFQDLYFFYLPGNMKLLLSILLRLNPKRYVVYWVFLFSNSRHQSCLAL